MLINLFPDLQLNILNVPADHTFAIYVAIGWEKEELTQTVYIVVVIIIPN